MFDLPHIERIDDELDVSSGSIQPFEHGFITTWVGRRKTPFGHRLVRAGRIVGWLCEGASATKLLGGADARDALEEAEKNQHRLVASSCSLQGLAEIATLLPEAFEFQADTQGLGSSNAVTDRLFARNISAVLQALSEYEHVRGALAADQGIIIDSMGDLPGKPEDLSATVASLSSAMDEQQSKLGGDGNGYASLNMGDASLLLASSSSIVLAVWTELDANHARLLTDVTAKLDGEIGTYAEGSATLPDGFVLREGKGGADAVMSMLTAALEERVTGHLKAGASDKAVSLALNNGLPVGMAANGQSFEDAMQGLTESKRVLKLHRLASGTMVSSSTGDVEKFTLQQFVEALSTVRTRSEKRRESMMLRLNNMYGFEIGLDEVRVVRSKLSIHVGGQETAQTLPNAAPLSGVDSGLRRRLEESERRADSLMRSNATLTSQLQDAEKDRTEAMIRLDEIKQSTGVQVETIQSKNDELNRVQVTVSESRARMEQAEERADRLLRRVSELEHQLSERASELAKALGDTQSSEALRNELEALSNQEATTRADMVANAERLSSIREQIELEERRLRAMEEQVSSLRERQADAQSKSNASEEKIRAAQARLDQIEAETLSSRRRAEEERQRLAEDEARRMQLHSEMRELMGERKELLTELGNLGARRGNAETELSGLISRAEALTEAHEEAVSDIAEAERLRARLSEEPLAQALLNDDATFRGLGPVLDRLEHARTLGYSVILLDRAVERALQIVQSTVDHIAATPRHLLSSEVMTLLERQVPQTAGAVRGLARWSVQQRLENQLGETVGHLILDLEGILEDYDRSITMLRRMRNVLDQLGALGAPPEEIDALRMNCMRPEALPSVAVETRRLIRVALDDIYLEADQRDAGEAIALEQTAQVLEELLTQIDASGLTKGVPRGAMWDFQRDGFLPFERTSIPVGQRTPVMDDMMEHIQPTLVVEENVSLDAEPAVVEVIEEWEEMPAPEDSAPQPTSVEETRAVPLKEDRADLEAELARLDSERQVRSTPAEEPKADPRLEALHDQLSELDF
ncbi:MAG: hypothetical protein ACPIBN_02295 [Candidatus Poseidoniaceae archaeon]